MSDEDPFEELDEAVEDREGDPFDSLGYPEDEEPSDGPDASGTDEGDSPASEESDDSPSPWGEPLDPDTPDEVRDITSDRHGTEEPDGSDGGDSPSSDPLADEEMTDTVDETFESGAAAEESDTQIREEPSIDTGAARGGDPFESMDDAFTEMDVEGVDPDDVWERLTTAESRGSVSKEATRTYAEVSKHAYCEQCDHFSEPPEIDCSHEGTEIVEFLDMERVRVVDCPIVAERKDLDGE